MDKDLVSIITANYNSEKYIEETIQSVLAQTYQNWEMLIVDDKSSDSSIQIIEKYAAQDKRIKLFFQEINSGPTLARNVGIQNANGKFIAMLDSDDLWLSDKLEKQIVVFEKEKDAVIAFSFYEHIDENGKQLHKVIKAPLIVTYDMMLKSNYIGNCTAVYKKNLAGNPTFANVGHEDYAMWLSILKNGMKAYCIPEVLAKYRKHQNSVSSNKLKGAKWHWNIHKNIIKTPFLKRCYYFLHYCFNAVQKHY